MVKMFKLNNLNQSFMKTLNYSVKLILILLVLGAISLTSCKKEASKEDTAKKEEQVTKKRNGEEFVGTWQYEDGDVLKIVKYKDLFVVSVIDRFGRKYQSYAYKYEEETLKGNEIIFYNSEKDCIYFKGEECRRIKK